MPYDPRPVSQGGNRGMGETFSRKAPPGKFRTIGVDTFDGTDWHDKDFDTLKEAKQYVADKVKGTQMLIYHVYDDQGRHLAQDGKF